MKLSPQELFSRWVESVVVKLNELNDGDGGFVLLLMSVSLYERFIDSKIDKEKGTVTSEDFWIAGKNDLNIERETFKRFWEGYRVGLTHSFFPKAYIEKKGKGDRWGWSISSNLGYKGFPEITHPEPDLYVITIDPWKFWEHVLKRWKENPELMNQLQSFQMGEIESIPKNLPINTKDYQYNPPLPSQTYDAKMFPPLATGIVPKRN